eukprot:COSAG06_NODE_666_length_13272_cov_10.674334_11_plen_234_part_00
MHEAVDEAPDISEALLHFLRACGATERSVSHASARARARARVSRPLAREKQQQQRHTHGLLVRVLGDLGVGHDQPHQLAARLDQGAELAAAVPVPPVREVRAEHVQERQRGAERGMALDVLDDEVLRAHVGAPDGREHRDPGADRHLGPYRQEHAALELEAAQWQRQQQQQAQRAKVQSHHYWKKAASQREEFSRRVEQLSDGRAARDAARAGSSARHAAGATHMTRSIDPVS